VTDPPGTPSETIRRVLSDDAAIVAVRRGAFRALQQGRAPSTSELAAAARLRTDQIERAIDELRDQGALEVDPSGRVIGAHGLTQRRTQHAIITSDRTWHTWCALDAIGIPIALGLDADVQTICPACGAVINVVIRREAPAAKGRPVLWQPTGPCSHVMHDFCAAANLFCSAEHVEEWRTQAGDPQGQLLTLGDVADQGRQVWSDVRP
jgi:alkylmercury lyase